ncbi:hypothetical protein HPP92_002874 [Vanilla planifolia]|nr:hypothetical protein HPP92_002874 [Vanilla planifolia]
MVGRSSLIHHPSLKIVTDLCSRGRYFFFFSFLLPLPPLFDSFDGPLSEMSSLMASLPIKRGLSKFFEANQSLLVYLKQKHPRPCPKKESKACKEVLWSIRHVLL